MFLKLLKEAIFDNWPMLTIFFITMVSLRVAYHLNHHEKNVFYKEVFNILAILYILLLFELLTNSEGSITHGFNIVPFSEITRYTFGSRLFLLNVVGNILIFLPFGFFVATYVKPKNILPVTLLSLIVSSSVEIIQLNIGRSFDIDDIILNVFGSILGYLLYVALNAIKNHLPKIFQKDWLYNLICFIIVIALVIYILSIMGVNIG